MAEAAWRMARQNAHLFAPANRVQLNAREAVLRLAARPFLARVVGRFLNRGGERRTEVPATAAALGDTG
jgi:hypothetical protein